MAHDCIGEGCACREVLNEPTLKEQITQLFYAYGLQKSQYSPEDYADQVLRCFASKVREMRDDVGGRPFTVRPFCDALLKELEQRTYLKVGKRQATNFLKQWSQAADEMSLYTKTLLQVLEKHPNIKAIQVHDSFTFEGSEEEIQEVLELASRLARGALKVRDFGHNYGIKGGKIQ